MPTKWRRISHDDRQACERFVEIVRAIDSRYRAFSVEQLQSWIDPSDRGTYVGQTVDAFGWFPRIEDASHPERMQIVVLGRYEPRSPDADAMMLGWSPVVASPAQAEVAEALDQILEVASDWLRTLDSSGNLKTMTAIRPKTNGSQIAQLLLDQLYWRAAIEPLPSPPSRYLRLVSERDLGDSQYWRLALIP